MQKHIRIENADIGKVRIFSVKKGISKYDKFDIYISREKRGALITYESVYVHETVAGAKPQNPSVEKK